MQLGQRMTSMETLSAQIEAFGAQVAKLSIVIVGMNG